MLYLIVARFIKEIEIKKFIPKSSIATTFIPKSSIATKELGVMVAGTIIVSNCTEIKVTPSILLQTTRGAGSSLVVVLEIIGSTTPLECVVAAGQKLE